MQERMKSVKNASRMREGRREREEHEKEKNLKRKKWLLKLHCLTKI